MTALAAESPWTGVYLVTGEDTDGPFAYIGKGAIGRGHASLAERDGSHVQMLAVQQSHEQAFVIETAVLTALKAVNELTTDRGVRLKNDVAGHGHKQLLTASALARMLNPPVGVRRTLTIADIGPALVVPVDWVRGTRGVAVCAEVYWAWRIGPRMVAKIRQLLRDGVPLKLVAVAPRSVVLDVFTITAVKTVPPSHKDAGRRYLGLQTDPDAPRLRGHYCCVPRPQGVRYLGRHRAGVQAFLEV